MKIKSRFTDKVIFEKDVESMRQLVEAAVAAGVSLLYANLSYADLRGANLRGANLSDANLSGANLSVADLSGANLSYANLRGANLSYANLRGANLSYADLSDADLRGANLSYADLSDADLSYADLSVANLRGADLSGANLSDSPKIENIHQTVFDAASQPGALDMSDWHTCDTTHCRAGWVTHLAGKAGAALEKRMGPSAAATLIYMSSDPKLEKIPDFQSDNETAMEDMKRLAELEAVAGRVA